MEYEIFLEKIKTELQNLLGDGYSVSMTRATKNNGISLDGITINHKQRTLSPVFSLNDAYRAYCEGADIFAIAGDIARHYHAGGLSGEVDLDFFEHYEEMKERVLFKLVHFHKNQNQLNEIPHIRYFDLAVVFYCEVPGEEFEHGTILIENSHLEMWQITPDGLYQDALRNTPREYPPLIQTMEEVMREMLTHRLKEKLGLDFDVAERLTPLFWQEHEEILGIGGESMRQDSNRYKMYVLTNTARLYGAATILYPGLVSGLAGKLAANLFILPSSVHESATRFAA